MFFSSPFIAFFLGINVSNGAAGWFLIVYYPDLFPLLVGYVFRVLVHLVISIFLCWFNFICRLYLVLMYLTGLLFHFFIRIFLKSFLHSITTLFNR
eukprot:04638_6